MTVTIKQGHVLDVLAEMPAQSVHTVCTSPPYWNLRNYSTAPQTWGGSSECGHVWGPAIVDKKRGQDAGNTARVGNTVARICPPETQQGAFCERCGAWRGELGSEPTLELFVRNLVAVFEAVKRVLRDDGTLWVNLGDSYASGEVGRHDAGDPVRREALGTTRKFEGRERQQSGADSGLATGNLCMAPARFALAMQAAGWTLRSEITLCKTAPMPESVQGARWERCRTKTAPQAIRREPTIAGRAGDGGALHFDDRQPSTSEWTDCPGCPKCAGTDGYVQRWGSGRPTSATERLFLFAKAGERYFYDLEAVRVPMAASSIERLTQPTFEQQTGGEKDYGNGENANRSARKAVNNLREKWKSRYEGWEALDKSAGRNLWNWLPFTPEPLAAAHYAAFPRWLPRLAIQAGTSEAGVCPGCGAPHLRIVERRSLERYELPPDHEHYRPGRYPTKQGGEPGTDNGQRLSETVSRGWRPSCPPACHQGRSASPATVLDVFAGSGTTLLEANALGRHGLGIELQANYVDIAHKRLSGQPLSLFAYEEPGAAGA